MTLALPSLDIRADFDSGNIQVIDASDRQHVRLAIRPDTQSQHFQWFHFKVSGLAPGAPHHFALENASASTFSRAWQGYQAVASYDQQDWFRVPSRFDGKALHFELSAEQPEAWFAYFEPYSRARHDQLISDALNKAGMQLLAVGRSIEGRDIPLLRLGNGQPGRRKLWFIAQQHPGEHMAEWFMEGIVERLQHADSELQALLAEADLYLVPNVNPDGAFHGHLRTNMAGRDLNRAWQDADADTAPEVLFIKQQMEKHGVDLFIDVHGDEEIPHVFTAACEGNPGYTPRIATLEQQFRDWLCAQTVDFQQVHGYGRSQPGKANLQLACNSVGETFDCLAFTLEMPFKDHDDAPNPRTGWNGARSAQLGKDVLTTCIRILPQLR
jgi:murein tripeptide amidase MpaA